LALARPARPSCQGHEQARLALVAARRFAYRCRHDRPGECGIPCARGGRRDIQADILATLGGDAEPVRDALDHLARLAGMPLANLGEAARQAVARQFRASGGPAAATLTRVVLQYYYRDDRVLRSLGLELRPPFPQGYALEQGDWSLLDPVRARPPI
jgi:hypothetical protein